MKELIDATRTRLASSSLLNYIDENWGQLDYAIAPAVKFPCALISIYSGHFTDIGMNRTVVPQNRQMGDFILELRVANIRLSPSSAKAKPSQKENTLSIFDVLQQIHELLHGWTPGGNIGTYIRSRVAHEKRDDGIQEYLVQYTIGLSNT